MHPPTYALTHPPTTPTRYNKPTLPKTHAYIIKPKAVDLLERAAELGDAPALNALAYLYKEGKGVDRDEGRAAMLFKEAALKVRGWRLG